MEVWIVGTGNAGQPYASGEHMTDNTDNRPALHALLGALRVVAARFHDDRVPTDPQHPAPAAVLTDLTTDWLLAAWNEHQISGKTRGQATGEDHDGLVIAESCEAIGTATRWSDAIAALCGVDVPDSGDTLIDAAHRALTAAFALVIARDGTGAAAVIYGEARMRSQDLRIQGPTSS